MIDEVGGGVAHTPGLTARTEAPLAGEGHEQLMSAAGTTHPGESMREDPAVEISTELALDKGGIAVSRTPSVGEEGLQVFADDRMA